MKPNFWIECSRLFRVKLRRSLREGAYKYGLGIQIEEDFGLLFGTIYMELTGEPKMVQQYKAAAIDMVQKWYKDDDE